MRNLELEKEMLSISTEIWGFIGIGKMPRIESKQGGASGCYYGGSRHTVYYRWNVWNKMPLAGKRMLAIHELYHAAGHKHDSGQMFCHAFDILTLELYKLIYGEDPGYIEAINSIRGIAEGTLIYSKSLKN